MRCLHEYNFQALGESAENLLSEVNDELEWYFYYKRSCRADKQTIK